MSEGILSGVADELVFDPSEIPHQDAYKLLIGSVVPRPIAWVSSMSAEGQLNLAPFSFFNAVCSKPMSVCFTVMNRGADGSKKDTLLNIEETGEFVVNLVTETNVEGMNRTSAEFPRGVSEFEKAGLHALPSLVVKPPRVAESPIQMECRLLQTVPVGEGPGGGTLIIGQVLRFHLRAELYDNGRIDPDRLHAVARMAGSEYARTRDRFSLERPASNTR